MSPLLFIFAIPAHYNFLVPGTGYSKVLLKRDLLIQVLKPDTAGPFVLWLKHDSMVEKALNLEDLNTDLFVF